MQEALGRPVVAPYRPAAHNVHTRAPDNEYFPTGQMDAWEEDDPAAHLYPAVQFPEHAALGRPGVPPYKPAAQSMHTVAPVREYLPTGHIDAMLFVDPIGQMNPAVQSPEHAGPVSAGVLPNTPAGHRVQALADARLYLPGGHVAAVALVDPATQA